MGLFGLGLAVCLDAMRCGTFGTAPSSSGSSSANMWLGFETFCSNSRARRLLISLWKNACCAVRENNEITTNPRPKGFKREKVIDPLPARVSRRSASSSDSSSTRFSRNYERSGSTCRDPSVSAA